MLVEPLWLTGMPAETTTRSPSWTKPWASAAAVVGELKLLVPLQGLVDLDAERARLDKEIARVSGEKDKSEAKLAKFTDKVPPAVVEQERQPLADWSSQLAALHAQRAKL